MEGRTFGMQSLRGSDHPVEGAQKALVGPEVLLSLLPKKWIILD